MVARLLLIALAALLAPQLHAADWLRAESDNFIVHAELEEEELRALVQRMEDFARLLENRLPGDTRLGRKPQLFIERNAREIAQLTGRNLKGQSFQNPEIGGAYSAYVEGEDPMTRDQSIYFALAVLHGDNAFFRPSPPWVRVGFPRTFSTTFRTEEGGFVIGAPDILRPARTPIGTGRFEWLLRTDTLPDNDGDYGRFFDASGIAARALLIDPEHSGLLEAYLDAFGEGRPMEEAALLLGELEPLVEDMQRLQSERRPVLRVVTLEDTGPATIAIRPMREDEIALIRPRVERAIKKDPERIANRLARLTQRYPESSEVWFEYAAAEFERVRLADFGGEPVFRGFGFSNGELIVSANPYSDAEAWRAVNRALALDPANASAIRLRAEILLSRLVRAGEVADADEYEAVRAALRPLAADPAREPLAAALLFQSHIEQGNEPPDEALDLLGRAFVANAGVEELRYAYAVALSRRGQRDVAERLLTSMLNNPEYRDAAQRALEATRL